MTPPSETTSQHARRTTAMLGAAVAGLLLLMNLQSVGHALRVISQGNVGEPAALVVLVSYWVAWSIATTITAAFAIAGRIERWAHSARRPIPPADLSLARRLFIALLVGWPPRARHAFDAELAGSSSGVSTYPLSTQLPDAGPRILQRGQTGAFTVIYRNSGFSSWFPGDLVLFDLDTDPMGRGSDWNDGWFGTREFATHSNRAEIQPGQYGFFVFSVRVPEWAISGTVYAFTAQLFVRATGKRLGPVVIIRVAVVEGNEQTSVAAPKP